MKKKNKLEELVEELDNDNIPGEDIVSFKTEFEDMFSEWLSSTVELHQVSSPFKIKTVADGARKVVDYFARCLEIGKPIVLSGAILALKLTNRSSLDLYATYHPEFESLIEAIKFVCENYAEEALFGKNSSGPKFVLMNRNKWTNREVSEVTTHNIEVKI